MTLVSNRPTNGICFRRRATATAPTPRAATESRPKTRITQLIRFGRSYRYRDHSKPPHRRDYFRAILEQLASGMSVSVCRFLLLFLPSITNDRNETNCSSTAVIDKLKWLTHRLFNLSFRSVLWQSTELSVGCVIPQTSLWFEHHTFVQGTPVLHPIFSQVRSPATGSSTISGHPVVASNM